MRKFLLTAIILATAFCQPAEAGKLPVIEAKKTNRLFHFIGKDVTVKGVVVSVGKSSADKIRFLDFTNDRERGFVAAIFPVVFKSFGNLEKFIGRRVEVTGKLEAYKTKTQIKIVRESQLKVLSNR